MTKPLATTDGTLLTDGTGTSIVAEDTYTRGGTQPLVTPGNPFIVG